MSNTSRISAPLAFALAAGVAVASCGGGSATPTASTPVGPQTTAFSGSSRVADNGGCSSLVASHAFSAGEGTLTVTLTQAAAPRMMIQVCAPTAVTHATECSIPPFAVLAVGQSVTGTVKLGRSQVVVVYPDGCGGPGATPTAPISYSVSVVHPG